MDVILLKDVEKLGAAGSVVQVRPGFARNYLLPAGLAVAATSDQLRSAQAAQAREARKRERARAEAEALKHQLEGRSLTLKLTLGADDKPFGSITVHDLAGALAQEGLTVEKHAIQLEQPIKTLGVYEIPVRLHPSVTATLKVWVVKA
jgi:large subunit ribosomal protein L9